MYVCMCKDVWDSEHIWYLTTILCNKYLVYLKVSLVSEKCEFLILALDNYSGLFFFVIMYNQGLGKGGTHYIRMLHMLPTRTLTFQTIQTY